MDNLWQVYGGQLENFEVCCSWCDEIMNDRLDELFDFGGFAVCWDCLANTDYDPDCF